MNTIPSTKASYDTSFDMEITGESPYSNMNQQASLPLKLLAGLPSRLAPWLCDPGTRVCLEPKPVSTLEGMFLE